MVQPHERLVNLAMYLASATERVSAEQIRTNVDGYPAHQDRAAFLRMFERDKEDLRETGLVIRTDPDERYSLDPDATFASRIALTAEEAATIRVIGAAFLDDPAFPFAEDLRLALVKIATTFEPARAPVVSRLAEEAPEDQGAAVAALDTAIATRKRVRLTYVNAQGEHKSHELEPFGLFVRDGRWYCAARDTDLDEVRLYAVMRMGSITLNTSRPKSPDFAVPDDFDVRAFIALPFQYGREDIQAVVRISADVAWKVRSLTAGMGATETLEDGSVLWTVRARDGVKLMRWVVEQGPGLELVAPASLAEELPRRLEEVTALHD